MAVVGTGLAVVVVTAGLTVIVAIPVTKKGGLEVERRLCREARQFGRENP
jgi:hypothetical protein